MESKFGLLMVLMQPPPPMEEEFNAWYDTEHLPERIVLPGFHSGARYICVDGYPRYMALYDLENEAVLESDAYMAISGSRFSPWTKRVTSRMPVWRVAATQIFPGAQTTLRSSRLLLVRLKSLDASDEAGAIRALEDACRASPAVTQLRLFASSDSAGGHFALIGLEGQPATPLDLNKYEALRGHVDIINTYVPYNPGG
jgi:hypothetical protein